MSTFDRPHGRQDITWLTDIEKIQAEIARDLKMDEPKGHITTTMEAAPPWISHEAQPPVAATHHTHPSFYTETIKSTRRPWGRTFIILFLVCTFGMASLGFGLGAAFVWGTSNNDNISHNEIAANNDTPTITSNRHTFDASGHQTGTVADMVASLEPAVVSITSRLDIEGATTVVGSGTVFAENEERIFIVTGSYIARPHSEIHVRIAGSQPLPARFDNEDLREGLAVISLSKAQLVEAGVYAYTIANFGDSSQMQVGDVVFAIGNARNEGISVTRGIVSAGVQELRLDNSNLTVLQTDAAINYGSSGGPLVNMNGEVIGINIDRATALFGSSAIEGIGYSIVSNVVLSVVEDLLNPYRPALGIVGLTVTEQIAMELGIHALGVFVQIVNQGGAAYHGGIQPYDIITGFGGSPIFAMDELITAIRSRRIGDTVEVQVLRNGVEHVTLEVELLPLIR